MSEQRCPYCSAALVTDDRGPCCPAGDAHPFKYRPGRRPPHWPVWGKLGGGLKGGSRSKGRKRKKPTKRTDLLEPYR